MRRSIGIVFQDETLDRDLTVWETLELHGRIYSMPKEERKERIEEIIKLVELEEKRNVRTRYLSGGMKRRLEIGRGLMTRPKVLFLDEPTIGLDTQTRRRLWDYIKEGQRFRNHHISDHPLHGRGRPGQQLDRYRGPRQDHRLRRPDQAQRCPGK